MKTIVTRLAGAPMDAIYIGRAGRGESGYFGNPFPREEPDCLAKWEANFMERVGRDRDYRRAVFALEGKTLACPGNCKPGPCHGDVFVRWIEVKREELEERAAILEFEGGLSREAAEKRAYELVIG